MLAPRIVREMTQLLRGVFLANHLASTDNLTRTTKRQNTYNENWQYIKRGPNKQQHNKKHAKIWQTASPGLVALYNIRPGNGSGPFLQPRSPHGAPLKQTESYVIGLAEICSAKQRHQYVVKTQDEIPVVWCATAFASIVLPQPGGPNISTPRGGSMPICLYSSKCVSGNSTASRTSCFWMSMPPMSE